MNETLLPTKTIQLCCTGILLDTIHLINLIKLKQCNINLKYLNAKSVIFASYLLNKYKNMSDTVLNQSITINRY